MASSVNEAFSIFLRDKVNLNPDDTRRAKRSRDWLISQIRNFPNKYSDFPDLYPEKDFYFGSFARRTKKRELDDIDLLIVLNAKGSTYRKNGDSIEIAVPDTEVRLKKLCNEGTNILNSKKVINKFLTVLDEVPQYKKADMGRRQEAAVLNLTSYPWSFDIVPCLFTKPEISGRDYYLIPDGVGNWKKTDPRKDKDRVASINQSHNGNVLNVIRILKYWNKRPTMPTMPSYLLENIVLDYYEHNPQSIATQWVDIEVINLFSYIENAIYSTVSDPKEIQGDLNTLTLVERAKISKRSTLDHQIAMDAREFEKNEDHKKSINKWQEIFGLEFPSYS